MNQVSENEVYIQQLISTNQVDQETVQAFDQEIKMFKNEHFSCNAKTSFKNCKQIIKGYEQILVYENGQFYQKLVPCAHLEKQLEKDKIIDRFFFVNFDFLHKEDFLFLDYNIKTQLNFYNLEVQNDWDQISSLVKDKNEFQKKSQIVKTFLTQMQNKTLKTDKGIYLVGTMGVGKTNLLKFLTLMAANNYQKTVAFTNVNSLVNKLKEGFDDETINVNKFLTNLGNVDFLVLDDLGSEQVTKWVRDDVLFTLLNHRMEKHKLTYFTSNLTWLELKKHYLQSNERDANKEIKANRLMERIKALSTETLLKGEDHRH